MYYIVARINIPPKNITTCKLLSAEVYHFGSISAKLKFQSTDYFLIIGAFICIKTTCLTKNKIIRTEINRP